MQVPNNISECVIVALIAPSSGTFCNEELQTSFTKVKGSLVCRVLVCVLHTGHADNGAISLGNNILKITFDGPRP